MCARRVLICVLDMWISIVSKLEVSGDNRDLGRGRPARDTEPRRPLTFVHVSAGDERGILGVLGDHRARQRARIFERAPHHVGIGDAITIVGEDTDPKVVQLDRRHNRGPTGTDRSRSLARRRGRRGHARR